MNCLSIKSMSVPIGAPFVNLCTLPSKSNSTQFIHSTWLLTLLEFTVVLSILFIAFDMGYKGLEFLMILIQ